MVIADDSTDESYIIVSDIAKVADNIVLVKQDNKGVSSAENIIIRRHLLLINGTLIVKFEEKASFMEDE